MAKATNDNKKKYEVTIKTAVGSCASSLFEKMAKKGDITSKSVKDMLGEVVKVSGYAECLISTSEKDFDVMYMDTDKGFVHTGSNVFIAGFKDYFEDTNTFRLTSVKTKNGTAYKPVPVLGSVDTTSANTDDDSEELPFN